MREEIKSFIQAIRNDEYAELEISDGVYLITDTEFDGTFFPYINDVTGKYSAEEIDHMLENTFIHEDVFKWDGVELDESEENIRTFYPYGVYCEFEKVDNSVWE